MKKLKSKTIVSLCLLAHATFAIDPAALYRNTIPENKNLDPAWVESLTERGHPLDRGIAGSKQKDTLKYIGMPVGGIGCGTVYLSGDGQLYVWDIWSQGYTGVLPNTTKAPAGYPAAGKGRNVNAAGGSSYLNPPSIAAFPPSFEQGFGIRFNDGSLQPFNAKAWESVEFTGTWPVGTVSYTDSSAPIHAELKAYSPFIPLDLEDSTIPVSILTYRLSNVSDQPISAELVAWLENMSTVPDIDPIGSFQSTTELSTLSHDCAMQVPASRKNKQKNSVHRGTMALSYLGQSRQTTVENIPGMATQITLQPGESRDFNFLMTWHFPVVRIREQLKAPLVPLKNAYASRFENAQAVADYVALHFNSLSTQTLQWVTTWNDSSLPQWLLDRTIVTADTLQTANCYLLDDGDGGRFWAWEGIGVCHGTCTHVWHYAQGMARLFPSLERNLREKTDFGFAQLEHGVVPFRGTVAGGEGGGIAIDGQCGTVLRSYREHQLSADDTFLQKNWPHIKLALKYLIDFDRNDGDFDGLLDGRQHNTLDASWYGKVHAISSLYIASLRAGEEMAKRVEDAEFAALCHRLYQQGSQNIETLYNGEYYVQEEDPNHPEAIGVGSGVYIDQVIGQFWANQLGLGRLYNKAHIRSALNALWKYNFVPDIAAFRETFREGRYYAWTGDAGLIMCTWPNGGLRENFRKHRPYRYFNECMSGFEYQAAAHMIAEGTPELLTKGLAITRAIHDRYRPEARNPYNEIECSDHYARAMSSYAVFLAAGGFEYDGPAGMMTFDPVIHPENFRTPFTAAEGWGTFSQTINSTGIHAQLRLNWGTLSLKMLRLNPRSAAIKETVITLNGKVLNAKLIQQNNDISIKFPQAITIQNGDTLTVSLRF